MRLEPRPEVCLERMSNVNQISAPTLLKMLGGLCLGVLATPALAQQPAGNDLSAGPKAIQPGSWVKAGDYPKEAWNKDQSGTVKFALTIDIQGEVSRCDILVSSGALSLDQQACALMHRNGRFKPALDAAGLPIPSEITRLIAWNANRKADMKYDAVVSVKSLPSDRKSADFSVRQIVTAGNRIESCALEKPSKEPSLDLQACKIASQVLAPRSLRAADGSPIRGLRISDLVLIVGGTGEGES